MIVINTPHNPIGKVFSKDELLKIADLCIKNNIIILSDEVYDRLYYVPFTRVATLSPEIERLTLTVDQPERTFMLRDGALVGLLDPRSSSLTSQVHILEFAILRSHLFKRLLPWVLSRPMLRTSGRQLRQK